MVAKLNDEIDDLSYMATIPERNAAINDAMLQNGQTFEEAFKEVVGKSSTASNIRSYARSDIITENRENFDRVLQDKLKPYARIVEAMDSEVDGRPDWKTRLQAIRQWAVMVGADPRTAIAIQVNSGNVVSFHIGDAYELTKFVTSEEDRIAMYNHIKQNERRGVFDVSPRLIEKRIEPEDITEIGK